MESSKTSVTQPQGGRGGGGAGRGGYYSSVGSGSNAGGKVVKPSAPSAGAAGSIMYPAPSGNFRGSSAQNAHVEAMKKATAEASKAGDSHQESSELAVKSGLGLAALHDRKLKQEQEAQARRDAARARRLKEETKKDADEQHMLAECEAQAHTDCGEISNLKYEAALIVRIAERFGASAVWTKIAEARARGADIPGDPRRVFLLVHPDKCPMSQASDATAIMNAQRPPEMAEVKARAPAAVAAATAAAQAAASASVAELSPTSAARHARMEARRQRAAAADGVVTGEEARGSRPTAAAPASVSTSAPVAPQVIPVSTADEGASAPVPRPISPAPRQDMAADGVSPDDGVERRVDPEDGASRTLKELREKYAKLYTDAEIEAYWRHDCKASVPKAKPKTRRF